jgi:hypothetical protein
MASGTDRALVVAEVELGVADPVLGPRRQGAFGILRDEGLEGGNRPLVIADAALPLRAFIGFALLDGDRWRRLRPVGGRGGCGRSRRGCRRSRGRDCRTGLFEPAQALVEVDIHVALALGHAVDVVAEGFDLAAQCADFLAQFLDFAGQREDWLGFRRVFDPRQP